eukprot:7569249-Pyramimonas_sp.AAC.1
MPCTCQRPAACATVRVDISAALKTSRSTLLPLSVDDSHMKGTRILLQVMLLGTVSLATCARISRISCSSR